MYHQQKRYTTAVDKLSAFKLGMASKKKKLVVTAGKDWHGSRGLKLQSIRSCHVF